MAISCRAQVLELAKRPNAVIKVSGACTLSRRDLRRDGGRIDKPLQHGQAARG
jgi:hypothetical protein